VSSDLVLCGIIGSVVLSGAGFPVEAIDLLGDAADRQLMIHRFVVTPQESICLLRLASGRPLICYWPSFNAFFTSRIGMCCTKLGSSTS
jgi:hypothetical protein